MLNFRIILIKYILNFQKFNFDYMYITNQFYFKYFPYIRKSELVMLNS